MIDPKPYIEFVDALNAMDKVTRTQGHPLAPLGIQIERAGTRFAGELDLGHYTVEYDSQADRWTLVSETDDAPDLCSHNQLMPSECSETDPCEQCYEVQVRLAEELDETNARRGW
jgi:hypothetical protein